MSVPGHSRLKYETSRKFDKKYVKYVHNIQSAATFCTEEASESLWSC